MPQVPPDCGQTLYCISSIRIAAHCAAYLQQMRLRWRGAQWQPLTHSTAAALPLTHRLDVLQWLHTDLQCPWEARFIIRIAAEKGMLPLLQWMWQQRDGAAVDNAYVTCAAA
eukprot:8394-Heterococcus_DN1.PRE.1